MLFDSEARVDRRRRDKDQRRAAANRRIGHARAYWYEAWDTALAVGPYLLAAGLCAWAWVKLPHEHIVRFLVVAGVVLVVAWAARNLVGETPAARINARASRKTRNRWHPAGLAGAALLIAAYLIWRSLP